MINATSSVTAEPRKIIQIIRYGVVGLASNLTAYSAYLFITYLGLESKQAMTCVYIVAALVGFFGNRTWTFAHDGAVSWAAARYFLAHLIGYSLNYLILFVFTDRLGYPHQMVQAAAIIVVAGVLFLTFKNFVFAQKSRVNP